jgi:hypothetical protein
MALWGKQNAVESRPKHLPDDSNSPHGREFVTATTRGWVMQPGVASAATGNDNTSADPEILVAIRNLSTALKSSNLMSVDFTAAAYADAADFDLTLTFDENITVTSATLTANQVVTNKAYILLDRLGATDMVSDNTIACQYYSGSGTNAIVFRGRLQSASAGYIGFADSYIHLNGTATMLDGDSQTICGIDAASASGSSDAMVLDGTDASEATINGAITTATTSIVVDGVSGATIIVGQVVTVKSAAASITDDAGATGISTDDTLNITAVASQTAFTVSEKITVADGVILSLQSNASDAVSYQNLNMTTEGNDAATNVVTTTASKTGSSVAVLTDTDGSSSGSANVLTGVTTT